LVPDPARVRPLKVGVQLPEIERVVRWPELAEMATTAETVGLDSIWLGDHLLYRGADGRARGPWEAWTTLSALAAVTSRIALGPLVAATSFHAPAMLAKLASTVDEVSDGRLILGLGAGWNEVEYRAFGFAFDQRVSRFEEAFTIIRTLLAAGSIDFAGRFYEARDCELLPAGRRPGGPPLLIGSTGARMLQITLPHVAAWNAWYSAFGNDLDRVPALLSSVDEACRRVGRDPATLERTLAVKVSLPGATGARDTDSFAPLRGTPRELAGALRRLAAMGVGHVQLVLDPITVAGIEALGPVLEELDRGRPGAA
jgi:alkanesulfonate monooxygenase SsuD/methylene tetrahydromethanopterin reductase-like flavin-dependent oxidoreductase (luciferase family)